MTDPKSIREAGLLIEGVEGRLGLLTKLIYAVLGTLGLIVTGGVTVLLQVGDVKTEVAVIRKDIASNTEAIKTAAKELGEVKASQTQAQLSLSRIETKLPSVTPPPPAQTNIVFASIPISPSAVQILRLALKQPPQRPGTKATFQLGDKISDERLQPLPSDLSEKLLGVKDVKYAFDQDSAIVLAIDNRVVVIVPAV